MAERDSNGMYVDYQGNKHVNESKANNVAANYWAGSKSGGGGENSPEALAQQSYDAFQKVIHKYSNKGLIGFTEFWESNDPSIKKLQEKLAKLSQEDQEKYGLAMLELFMKGE